MPAEPILWSRRQLRAASWVTRVLGVAGEPRTVARASWSNLPLGSEVDFDELELAEAGLREAGLLRVVGARLVPTPRLRAACATGEPMLFEQLLGLILEASEPLWLITAAGEGDQLAAELVPDEVVAALSTVIADPARREAFLLGRARTVDANRRAALGEAGEDAVVAACRQQLLAADASEAAAGVRRVSLISDELGYDVVAPRLDRSLRRLEVKATRSSAAAVTVVLTRNEIEVGRADPDWSLVVVRVAQGGEYAVVGHATTDPLEPLLPADGHELGRWQSAALRLAVGDLEPGLPTAGAAPSV
jgi:hypothetical protein